MVGLRVFLLAAALTQAVQGFVLPMGSHSSSLRPMRAASTALNYKVTIQHEGKDYEMEVDGETSILDAAIDNNIDLPYDCKLGVCLTCPSKVVSGEVDQSSGTLEDTVTDKGYALTCCTFARSDCVIRSIEEDELVGAQFEKF